MTSPGRRRHPGRSRRPPRGRHALRVAGLTTLLLTALAAGPAAPEEGAPAPGPAELTVDRDASWFVAVTDRAGMLGFLGHRHSVLATEWTAELRYDPDDPSSASVRVTVPTAAVRIDTERGHELAGLDGRPDAETVATLQEKVLAPENLAAGEHPELRFVSTGVERTGLDRFRVTGELTVRGVTRTVRVPVRVKSLRGGSVRFSGEVTVDQSAFGIEPESIAGVVRVADPVEIRFQVVASAP